MGTSFIEVQTSFRTRMLATGIVGGALILTAIVAYLTTTRSKGPPIGLFALAGLGVIFCCIPLVLSFERARTVRRFDLHGVTLYDGRFFEWKRLRGTHPMTEYSRARTKSITVGLMLDFDTGSAVIKSQYVTNWSEVEPLLGALNNLDAKKVQEILAAHGKR